MLCEKSRLDRRMAVAGSPEYFAKRTTPYTPRDLTDHQCINLRLPTHGGLYNGIFKKDGDSLNVRVDGQTVFNSTVLNTVWHFVCYFSGFQHPLGWMFVSA